MIGSAQVASRLVADVYPPGNFKRRADGYHPGHFNGSSRKTIFDGSI